MGLAFDQTQIKGACSDLMNRLFGVPDPDLNLNKGIPADKSGKTPGQHIFPDCKAGSDPQRAGDFILQQRNSLGRFIIQSQHHLGPRIQNLPGFRQADLLRIAVKKPCAELVLQIADMEADPGLREIEPLGRSGEMALLGDCNKYTNRIGYHSESSFLWSFILILMLNEEVHKDDHHKN
ncbi:hypothetical protein D3C71_1626230 [compost metagenome]